MVPLSLIFKKVNACYKQGKKEYKLNHFLFIDDLKLYAKNEEQAKRMEGGRGLIIVKQQMREEENSLGFYVANLEENLIREVLDN